MMPLTSLSNWVLGSKTCRNFRSILAILLLTLTASESLAFSWSNFIEAIKQCLDNPCDCGSSSPRVEYWGTISNSFPQNANCPPYNRAAGRDNNTCLVGPGHSYPSNGTSFYLSRCAEQAPESSYFMPQIRVRNQNCNGLACWSVSKSLSWDGQCVVWASAYGIPLLRICARIAQAANSQDPINPAYVPADPGYTQGMHLDYKGATVADDIILDYAGNPITTVSSPKLCAYNDPSALDVLTLGITTDGATFPDVMDFNPLKQPLHQTTQPSIITKIILLFLNYGAQSADSLISMLQKVFNAVGSFCL
ncbi:MAG: hypothetical protein ACRYE9_06155, partial [Janthinobacterium lividum]